MEVCTLPLFSVGGTLCTLWIPDSLQKNCLGFSPVTSMSIDLLFSVTFVFILLIFAYLTYTSESCFANNDESFPPSPGIIEIFRVSKRPPVRLFVLHNTPPFLLIF